MFVPFGACLRCFGEIMFAVCIDAVKYCLIEVRTINALSSPSLRLLKSVEFSSLLD